MLCMDEVKYLLKKIELNLINIFLDLLKMVLKRHQQFRLDAEKKWTEKWFKFITSHFDCDWTWEEIQRNSNVTMEFIEAHPEYPWNWKAVSIILILL